MEPSKKSRVYLLPGDETAPGAPAPCDRLPRPPALATRHGVARATFRRALDQPSRKSLIEQRPGAGTLVREPARPVIGAAPTGPEVAQELEVEVGSTPVSITRATHAECDAIGHLHAVFRSDRNILGLGVERDRSTQGQL